MDLVVRVVVVAAASTTVGVLRISVQIDEDKVFVSVSAVAIMYA